MYLESGTSVRGSSGGAGRPALAGDVCVCVKECDVVCVGRARAAMLLMLFLSPQS